MSYPIFNGDIDADDGESLNNITVLQSLFLSPDVEGILTNIDEAKSMASRHAAKLPRTFVSSCKDLAYEYADRRIYYNDEIGKLWDYCITNETVFRKFVWLEDMCDVKNRIFRIFKRRVYRIELMYYLIVQLYSALFEIPETGEALSQVF